MEVAGVQHLLFDLHPTEVAGFEHRGDNGAGLLCHHGLPAGVYCDKAREAVQVRRGGIHDSCRGSTRGRGGGAQTGDQEVLREASTCERRCLDRKHIFAACCGGGQGVENNPRGGGVAGLPVGQNSGEGDGLKRAGRCQDHRN